MWIKVVEVRFLVVEKNTKASVKHTNNRVVINERDLNIRM